MGIVRTILDFTTGIFFPADDDRVGLGEDLRERIVAEAEAARGEWLRASAYFNDVTDPDLVDHAIYCVEAAERKYMYLLKKARRYGIDVETRE